MVKRHLEDMEHELSRNMFLTVFISGIFGGYMFFIINYFFEVSREMGINGVWIFLIILIGPIIVGGLFLMFLAMCFGYVLRKSRERKHRLGSRRFLRR